MMDLKKAAKDMAEIGNTFDNKKAFQAREEDLEAMRKEKDREKERTLSMCPFENANCMCQFCEDPCNNGLNCSDCNHSGKAEHNIYLCTGFRGDLDAYIRNYEQKTRGRLNP